MTVRSGMVIVGILFISLTLKWVHCQVDLYEAEYVKIRDDDCAPNTTRDHQRFLFTTYRALYDYRKYHHNYNLTENAEKWPRDEPDSPDNDGSVVFYNWQDTVRKMFGFY